MSRAQRNDSAQRGAGVPGRIAVSAAVVCLVLLAGCSSEPDALVGGRDPVVGVSAAPAETDTPAPVVQSPGEIDEAVRAATLAYLNDQLPGAAATADPLGAWLRPGDTGPRYIARWSADSDGEVTTGEAALSRSSDGTFSVVEAESDGESAQAALAAGGILLSVESTASQTAADAARDGVSELVASLSLSDRVDLGWGAPDYLNATIAQDDRWIVSRYPLEVGIQLRDGGDIANVDTVLAYELLHLSGGDSVGASVVQAIPTDVLSPAWIASGNGAVYSGRKAGTSSLNPILIRIDSSTGTINKLIAVLPDRVISDEALVPSGWTIASPEQAEMMVTVAHAAPDFVLIDEIFSLGA